MPWQCHHTPVSKMGSIFTSKNPDRTVSGQDVRPPRITGDAALLAASGHRGQGHMENPNPAVISRYRAANRSLLIRVKKFRLFWIAVNLWRSQNYPLLWNSVALRVFFFPWFCCDVAFRLLLSWPGTCSPQYCCYRLFSRAVTASQKNHLCIPSPPPLPYLLFL